MALNVTQKCNFPGFKLFEASKFSEKIDIILIQNFIVCAIYLTMCENYLTRRKVFFIRILK